MSEFLRIAVSIFVYVFLGFLFTVAIVGAFAETRRWLRESYQRRRAEIEPSPLIRESDRRRAAHDRAFNRAGIVPLQGHPRLGIDHVKRGRGA